MGEKMGEKLREKKWEKIPKNVLKSNSQLSQNKKKKFF